MLRRKITDYFVNWKEKERRKSIIIDGPRQVGKTTSVVDFIENHYDDSNTIYIDFKSSYSLGRIFKRDFPMNRIYQEIKLHFPEKTMVDGESIIFFDNIQLCPEMVPYLRAFTEDRVVDVIAAGSSLGVVMQNTKSYPVGYVEQTSMTCMDFEEYLWASGYDQEQVDFFVNLYQRNELKTSSIHGVLIDLFREYIAIGGMPEVVNEYIKQNNFKLAYDVQQKIIEMYIAEMEIHTKKTMFPKVVECFHSIRDQLTKDNKKFQFKHVSEKARSTTYQSSVEWLIDAGLVYQSFNVVKPIRPLHVNKIDKSFKLYLFDTGLLTSMYGEATQLEILKGNLDAKNYGVLENAVATMLYRNNHELYYYEKNSTLDIDFVIMSDRVVCPLLVRNGDNTKSKALKVLEEKFGLRNGTRLSCLESFSTQIDNIIPIYMAGEFQR